MTVLAVLWRLLLDLLFGREIHFEYESTTGTY